MAQKIKQNDKTKKSIMINRKFFFDNARTALFNGTMRIKQVHGLTIIFDQGLWFEVLKSNKR
ncbi:hypothetical protein HYN49_08275 [Flavobacterium pallidum]|uniref:Uncharacterized protein n=1 Tax=Flavobacterium pallidum TaxID=2172098 RepID=A0A2S1SHK7_9FLAO|nr:hypothetical protein HYN49_08275 [Flavobacterium pallidum]